MGQGTGTTFGNRGDGMDIAVLGMGQMGRALAGRLLGGEQVPGSIADRSSPATAMTASRRPTWSPQPQRHGVAPRPLS